jgi:hypothetical protein
MAHEEKKQQQQTGSAKGGALLNEPIQTANTSLSASLAVGIISLALTIIALCIVSGLVYCFYTPDIDAIKNAAAPLSIFRITMFHPEPVERTQFQLFILLMPVFVFMFYSLVSRKKEFLINYPYVARSINYVAFAVFLIYLVVMLNEPLKETKLHDKVNTYFFEELLSGKYTIFALIVYGLLAYLFLLGKAKVPAKIFNNIMGAAAWCFAGFAIYEVIVYNTFHLSDQNFGTHMETNAVFYSVTQVFAGKSLLVDFNAQYGLYAWILKPLFSITGLTIEKFTATMAVLNGLSYLFLYLAIKKIIRNNLFALVVFFSLLFWQYWHLRVGFEEASNPSYYFQYWPIRLFFPCLVFYLFSCFLYAGRSGRRYLLPVLAVAASLGLLWNLDSGLVAFGAACAGLAIAAIHYAPDTRSALNRITVYAAWMAGALFLLMAVFAVSTRLHSGTWPELARFTAFQKQFYISGYFMLPMTALHFWNVVAVVYIIATIYVVSGIRKTADPSVPVIAFLVILGMGLFTYFQGRSYDLTLMIVMYPAIIIAGIFCNKITPETNGFKIRYHEILLFFFIPFLFLADGALSMVYFAPDIHTLAANNTILNDNTAAKEYKDQIAFIKKHVPEHDTLIIISKDFESYYYAAGNYYNPLNIPGSTELFLRSDFDELMHMAGKTRYPVIYDAVNVWEYSDSIVTLLSQNTEIRDEMPDHSLVFLEPVKQKSRRLPNGRRVMYSDYLDGFRRYMVDKYQLDLGDRFTLELLISLDPSKLKRNEVVFSTAAKATPNCGFFMRQHGDKLNEYAFTYGNGVHWCDSVIFDLRTDTENHLVLRVQKNIITAFNNGMQCSQVNTGSAMKNSEGALAFNQFYSGRVEEVMLLDE